MFSKKKSDPHADGLEQSDGERMYDQDTRGNHTREVPPEPPAEPATPREEYANRKEEFGGLKEGAVFYGWLVAVAMTILLVGIVSAIATGVDSSLDVTKAEAQLRDGTIAFSAAIAILAILALGYFAGGYVAGRMSRFNGARQGVGVWALGLVITAVVVAIGSIFGDEYNVFERVNLTSLPVQANDLTPRVILTLAAVLVATLVTSVFGGILGQRYHSKIDRTVLSERDQSS